MATTSTTFAMLPTWEEMTVACDSAPGSATDPLSQLVHDLAASHRAVSNSPADHRERRVLIDRIDSLFPGAGVGAAVDAVVSMLVRIDDAGTSLPGLERNWRLLAGAVPILS